ncbi:MAG: hypothetical protein ABJF01_21210 [bacterium]
MNLIRAHRAYPAFPAVAFATLFTLTAAVSAQAQSAGADARWQAWLGCWQTSAASAADLPTSSPVVCVAPTRVTSAVRVTTFSRGAVVSDDTIDASGQHRAVDKQGCAGWQRGEWSADARRVYLRSQLTCTGGVARVGTGILAMSPTGDWLDVEGLSAGANSGVRAMRFHNADSVSRASLPGAADVSVGRELAVQTARAVAGAPLGINDVVEAVNSVDTAVVQTWIAQRGVRFVLSAKELIAMADAGVPGSVTDVMIGISYPEHFALQQSSVGTMAFGNQISPRDSARIAAEYARDGCDALTTSLLYSFDTFNPCAYRYGLRGLGYGSAYSRYGYASYGYNPYFGYGGYGAGYYSAPIIVVKGEETPHGKVVKGRGYSRGDDGGGSSSSGASSRTSSGASNSGSSGSSSSGSSSGGSSSSGSSSSGASAGRTAIPRPPT